MLSDSQIERYSRQVILPEVGGRGQQQLLHSAVLVVGDGPIAEIATAYLAGAGVGRLTAAPGCIATLTELNPDCQTAAHQWPSGTALERDALIRNHDMIIDIGGPAECSNLLNAACIQLQRQLLWGRASDAVATLTMFAGHLPGQPCYSCMPVTHATRTPAPAELADLSARFLGGLVAVEAIKSILSIGTSLCGRLLVYDPLRSTVDEVPVPRNPDCVACDRGAHVVSGQAE